MDQDKLADLRPPLRRRQGRGALRPRIQARVADPVPGRAAQMAVHGAGDLAVRAAPAERGGRELRRPRRRARRRADGSRRHQPGRRPARAAGGAGRRAHRPLRARAEMRALERGAGRRHRRRAVAQPLLASKAAMPTSRAISRAIRAAGVRTLAVGGDHSISLPILKALGKRPAARHDPYRRPLRHLGRVRGREVPPRRAVPAGRARGRARPGAHDPDRHPRRRRISVGVLLRFGG